MQWLYLGVAILLEVGASIALRIASTGRTIWYAPVVVGYVAAFVFLALTLDAGLGLGVAYGIWAAVGVALTAVASKFLFDEPLTLIMSCGIVLVIGGVLLVELGGVH